jgi:hypothetical protein
MSNGNSAATPEGEVRAAALLALLAMALQAFWPLLAQAKPGPGTMLVQLCTIDGTAHYVEIPIGGDAPAEERTPGHSSHCAMCVPGGERVFAVPSAQLPAIALAALASTPPPAIASARFVSASHRLAQPRAPPQSL